jgi:hypothetical protein
VKVRNRYIPSLYRILDECNKMLPASTRFNQEERFVRMNECIEKLIDDNRERRELPDELRAKVIAELTSQIVAIEN